MWNHLRFGLIFGLLSQSAARSFLGTFRRDICPPGFPSVVVSLIEEVTVYPVYINTYITSQTTIVIKNGPTIECTIVPTQIVTSELVTTTTTVTKTEYPGQ